MNLRSLLISVTAMALWPTAAAGICLENPDEPYPRLARVEVASCQTASEFAEAIAEVTPLPWFKRWLQGSVEREPGVVVTGTVVEAVVIRWYGESLVAGEHMTDPREGRWYYPTEEDDQCEQWTEKSIVIVLDSSCCDVIPPPDMPCLLDVGLAGPVPAELEEVLPAY